jgi:hypothetical protein
MMASEAGSEDHSGEQKIIRASTVPKALTDDMGR